jgi:hypothetical protein
VLVRNNDSESSNRVGYKLDFYCNSITRSWNAGKRFVDNGLRYVSERPIAVSESSEVAGAWRAFAKPLRIGHPRGATWYKRFPQSTLRALHAPKKAAMSKRIIFE